MDYTENAQIGKSNGKYAVTEKNLRWLEGILAANAAKCIREQTGRTPQRHSSFVRAAAVIRLFEQQIGVEPRKPNRLRLDQCRTKAFLCRVPQAKTGGLFDVSIA